MRADCGEAAKVCNTKSVSQPSLAFSISLHPSHHCPVFLPAPASVTNSFLSGPCSASTCLSSPSLWASVLPSSLLSLNQNPSPRPMAPLTFLSLVICPSLPYLSALSLSSPRSPLPQPCWLLSALLWALWHSPLRLWLVKTSPAKLQIGPSTMPHILIHQHKHQHNTHQASTFTCLVCSISGFPNWRPAGWILSTVDFIWYPNFFEQTDCWTQRL